MSGFTINGALLVDMSGKRKPLSLSFLWILFQIEIRSNKQLRLLRGILCSIAQLLHFAQQQIALVAETLHVNPLSTANLVLSQRVYR